MSKTDPKIEALADWLEKQAMDGSITDRTIWDSLGLSRSVFYTKKPKAVELMQQRAEKRQKALEQAKTQQLINAAVNGLKTKQERLLILQKQIDACIGELEEGQEREGKLKLDVYEKVALRKTLRELQAEISKIEGDYAPIKQAQTDADGNDIDYSKLSTATLAEIVKAMPVADLN